MTVVVVAEKPSVGRDLARVLGATQRGEGLLLGNGYVVTWAIGHLVGLAEPEGIRPEWKRWSRATLPMLPQEWPLQVLEVTPRERIPRAQAWLSQPGRLPAIVYAPTRKNAEAAAAALGESLRAAPYHAGLSPAVRASTQTAFLSGQLDVVVATVAFGMGVDKANVRTVVHLALPGSVEAYYQEIGRAGRDGLPSRAVLMQHFVDRKTHEFFLARDYPDAAVLQKVARVLSDSRRTRSRCVGDGYRRSAC